MQVKNIWSLSLRGIWRFNRIDFRLFVRLMAGSWFRLIFVRSLSDISRYLGVELRHLLLPSLGADEYP